MYSGERDFRHVLVTGGVGSVGRNVVERLLAEHPTIEKITIFSRDEHKQGDMSGELAAFGEKLKFVIGDIREAASIEDACLGVDAIVHAAAMRLVPQAAKNPWEAVKTNVQGAENLIRAARKAGVKHICAISSDKAVDPTTAYGASKFLMERLLLKAELETTLSTAIVRYANILNSRSSVAPLFLKQRAQGYLTITDPNMTRFSITMREGIDLVMFGLFDCRGGEIVCPISPSYRVADMAEAIGPDVEHRIIGAREGEKLDESMYSRVERHLVYRTDQHYLLFCGTDAEIAQRAAQHGAAQADVPESYDSGSNTWFIDAQEIREIVCREFGLPSING